MALAVAGTAGTSPAAAAISSACTRSAVGGCVRSDAPQLPKEPDTPPPALHSPPPPPKLRYLNLDRL